jgi:hypothetical protein
MNRRAPGTKKAVPQIMQFSERRSARGGGFCERCDLQYLRSISRLHSFFGQSLVTDVRAINGSLQTAQMILLDGGLGPRANLRSLRCPMFQSFRHSGEHTFALRPP